MDKQIKDAIEDKSKLYRYYIHYITFGKWGWAGKVEQEGDRFLYGVITGDPQEDPCYDVYDKKEVGRLVKWLSKAIQKLKISDTVDDIERELLETRFKEKIGQLCDELEKFRASDDLTFEWECEDPEYDELYEIFVSIEHLSIQ